MIKIDAEKIDDPTAQYFTWPEFKRCVPLMFRSSIVASLIGMMPGLGSSVACFVAYGEESGELRIKTNGALVVEESPLLSQPTMLFLVRLDTT